MRVKKNKFIEEFKKFISKGNVIDLAVGIVVGTAFSKIVSSLVENIITPIIGIISGGINFTSLSIKIGNAIINYGLFIQSIIDFLIIALCIFVMIKVTNKFRAKKNTPQEMKKEEVILLEEIRDLLAKK